MLCFGLNKTNRLWIATLCFCLTLSITVLIDNYSFSYIYCFEYVLNDSLRYPAHKSELDYTGCAASFDLFGCKIRLCCLHCIFLIDKKRHLFCALDCTSHVVFNCVYAWVQLLLLLFNPQLVLKKTIHSAILKLTTILEIFDIHEECIWRDFVLFVSIPFKFTYNDKNYSTHSHLKSFN